MRSKKFPSKLKFTTWWNGREDIFDGGNRDATCPIAQYLKAHGAPNPLVDSDVWYFDGIIEYQTPKWAQEFIKLADQQAQVASYKGLPKGFK